MISSQWNTYQELCDGAYFFTLLKYREKKFPNTSRDGCIFISGLSTRTELCRISLSRKGSDGRDEVDVGRKMEGDLGGGVCRI